MEKIRDRKYNHYYCNPNNELLCSMTIKGIFLFYNIKLTFIEPYFFADQVQVFDRTVRFSDKARLQSKTPMFAYLHTKMHLV